MIPDHSDDVHWNVRTNISWLKKSLVIFLGFLKMIKLLVIHFILKLYSRNNISIIDVRLAYKSFLSRFSMLINYTMWSSNLFCCIQLFPSFFWVQVFLGPDFSGFRFFWVQVFQGSGPGSGSRAWIQVLEVAL